MNSLKRIIPALITIKRLASGFLLPELFIAGVGAQPQRQEQRKDSPLPSDVPVIEERGSAVTITTPDAPAADGRERSRTGAGDRTVRASLKQLRLA
jgi:hypothetical protein